MLISLLVLLLLSNALSSNKTKSPLYSRSTFLSLFFISEFLISNIYLSPLSNVIGIYGGLFSVSILSHTMNIFIFILAGFILTLNSFYPRKVNITTLSLNESIEKPSYNHDITNKTGKQFTIIEYALISVFVITGAVFLISSEDLVSIFLSIELQSYGLYIISALYRDSELATGSALTYFLLGGLASCFILLGSGLLYSNTGTTALDNIYIINNIADMQWCNNSTNLSESYYISLCLIIMITGFLFKISAAPFHFWSPDVYDGIPTIVTTFVAIIAKISIFTFLLGIVYYTELDNNSFSWKNILLLSSMFSLIIGSVLGLTQSRIKRLFAYSTISHIGFILLALSINSTESIQAYIFYILQYSLANLNAFVILITIGYTFYLSYYKNVTLLNSADSQKPRENKDKLIDVNNSPVQLISQIKGYFEVNSYLAVSLAITLFSFVGIPPLMGFFAKQMIISAALDKGYVFMTLIAIITSVIGAGYYLNLIRQIFFYKTNSLSTPLYSTLPKADSQEQIEELQFNTHNHKYTGSSSTKVEQNDKNLLYTSVNSSLSFIISSITLLLSVFIFIPGEWLNVVLILSIN